MTDPTPPAAEYTVVARRYRPQQFAELIGQEPAAQALAQALRANRVAHAYLFTGPRGVGKTSTARILAKALNCETGPTPTPCDRCATCRAIAAGEAMDVLEIDGASNRGIDDVRALRQNVQTRPAHARYKVYIIDEVHMLTRESFNALLKTLEEPPPHVKFVFATTEVQKVPVTILSRCQRFDLGTIAVPQIAAQLAKVVAGEGRQADPEALAAIARRAGGSMRDAESLLEQLLAFGGERLTLDQVHALLGTTADEQVAEIARAVLARDLPRSLALLGHALDQGSQLGEVLDQLIEHWRGLMLVGVAGPDLLDPATTPGQREELVRQAAGLSPDTVLAGLDILAATKARTRGSPHARLLVEMALVRLGRLEDLLPLSQFAQALAAAGPAGAPVATAAAAVPEAKKKRDPDPPAGATPQGLTTATLPQLWEAVLAKLGPFFAIQARRAGLPAILGPKALALNFPSGYDHDYEYCAAPDRLAELERAVRQVTGHEWQVRVERAGPAPEPRGQPPARNGSAPAATAPPPRSAKHRELLQREPLLGHAMAELGAQVLAIDPAFGTPAATNGKPQPPSE